MLWRGTMRLRCRAIREEDLSAVAGLLSRGFPARGLKYWTAGLGRLSARSAVGNYPRHGYLLEEDGEVCGVVLTIFSECVTNGEKHVRCNVSSWYVEPRLKSYAAMLTSFAQRDEDVTYLNVSPAPHTRPIIEAQGFQRFCNGQLVSTPLFQRRNTGVRALAFTDGAPEGERLTQYERDLIAVHVEQGCIAMTCAHEGQVYPFIFLPRTMFNGKAPCLHLIFCRRMEDFVRFAGALGRALIWKKHLLVVVDSNGPIPGLPGRYFPDLGPKYFKGPRPPALGDMAHTEGVFFHR